MSADPNPSNDTLSGQVLAGRYRVIEAIAKGGMGRIYKAEQLELGRLVALKILDASTEDPEGFRKRFTLEAATSARLSHPNIVVVHDYGSFDHEGGRRYFMAMELIDGRTLQAVVKDAGALDVHRAAFFAREVARALREAHRQGVVHRDLKPSNVMISDRADGEHVKVLDFGIAKVLQHDGEEITREGAFVGTPRYMSPEQLSGGAVDARSDIYSLGVLCFQMLSGKPPHSAKDVVQAMVAHLTEAPPELPEPYFSSTPEGFRDVIRKCLAREPANRWQDASAFLRALDASGVTQPSGALTTMSGATPISREMQRPSEVIPFAVPIDLGSEEDAPTSAATPISMARPNPPVAPAEPTSPRPSWMIPAIALGVTALVGLLAFLAWPHEPPVEPSTPPPTTVAAPSPPPTLVAPPPTSAPPQRFVVRVDSEPTGAIVRRDGVVLGPTPLSIELDPEALRAQAAEIRVEHEGYEPYIFSQGPSDADVVVHAALVAVRAAIPAHRPRPPRTPGEEHRPPPPEDRMLKTSR